MNTIRLQPLMIPVIGCALAAPALAGGSVTFVETMDATPGGNVGDWMFGNIFEKTRHTQGAPGPGTGAWRYAFHLHTCCPSVNTRWGQPSVFTGNLKERGVRSIGIDTAVLFVGFAACGQGPPVTKLPPPHGENGADDDNAGTVGRATFGSPFDGVHPPMISGDAPRSEDGGIAGTEPPLWLVLVSDNGTPNNFNDDWGATFMLNAHTVTPAPPGLFSFVWRSYDLNVSPAWLESETLPPGWEYISFGASSPPPDWQTLIQNVAQVRFYYNNPHMFHLFQDWRIGADNARITLDPSGEFTDCNESGQPDAYDIASGASLDCDRDGVPDECQIAAGLVGDCNNNGVMDPCDAIAAAYSIDGGFLNDAIGPGGAAPPGQQLIWANRFNAGAGDVITNISVAFHGSGGLQPGDPITVFLWDDPNNDGNPSDAALLASAQGEVLTVNPFGVHALASFDTYSIEPTQVTGSFFAGVMAAEGTFPAAVDLTTPVPERSFSIGLARGADPTAAFQSALTLEQECIGGNYMIRVNGNDANNTGLPDECDVPDNPFDLNGDGVVNVFDLLLLLGAWGPCPNCPPQECPADFNDDCVVNVFDLLLLLGNWG